jgi:glycosyltransferase involved in cell wall biosynthesis
MKALADGPRVVHFVGAGWELLGFAALAEARRAGAAFSVCPAVHPGTWGDSSLDIELYRRADAVFALSEFERDHLARLGVPESRIVVTGLGPAVGAEGSGHRFRSYHGLGTRPIVLFIGRKQKYKGYHCLRQSLEKVLAVHPNVCLVSIGPWGEPPYPYVPKSALLDLESASDQDKADALAACDVFCMPSSGESFGIAYVEAWSYAKPVVAGPAPAARELVSDGINGFCVEQTEMHISSTLIRLLSDPDLCHRLGTNGKTFQQSRFSWEKVAEFHSDVFARMHPSGNRSDPCYP